MQAVASKPVDADLIPPLENGAEMDGAEFLRRYEAEPDGVHAQLINGVVFMSFPISIEDHGAPDNLLQTWLGSYAAFTPRVRASGAATLVMDEENTLEPDGMLCLRPEFGGKTTLVRGKYLAGVPELVVEIAASSRAIDLHGKLRAYRRSGVPEYLVWSTLNREFFWFRLEGGEYVPNPAGTDGIIRSAQFPGLHLDVDALLEMDGKRVLAALQAGLASPEHAAFVERHASP